MTIKEDYLININSNLLECLLKFEENNVHTLLVVSEDTVVGTVTDGDIRKALIKSRSLSTVVDTVMNLDFIFANTLEQAEMLINDFPYVFLIPIIDENRKLIEIYVRPVQNLK
jgi:CBS domain-containing protein